MGCGVYVSLEYGLCKQGILCTVNLLTHWALWVVGMLGNLRPLHRAFTIDHICTYRDLNISRRFFLRIVGFEALTLLLTENSFLVDFIMEVCSTDANVLKAYFIIFTGRFCNIRSANSKEES